MANAVGMKVSKAKEHSAALVDESLVINAAEVMRGGGPEKPRLVFDPFDIDESNVAQWQAAGLKVFLTPIACMDADYHAGIFRAIAAWNAVIAGHADRLMRVDRPADIELAVRLKKIGIVISVHHGEHFRRLDDIDFFYRHGQRVCLITSHAQNMIGSPMNDRHDAGLTFFGLAVVERMNKLGMAIDISHCGDRTALDAIEASKKPVLLSHANAYAVCPNPRNKKDEIIKRLAERCGVLGLMSLRMMVRDREPTTIEHFLDHVDYVAKLVGPEFVGLGFESPPEGFDNLPPNNQLPLPKYMLNEGQQRGLDIPELCHERRIYDITEGLVRRGYSDKDIQGILGGNFKRVLTQVWSD